MWAPVGKLIVPEASIEAVGFGAVIAYVSASTADQVSVHHGHTPNIEIKSDTTATGIWAMEDACAERRNIRLRMAAPTCMASAIIMRNIFGCRKAGASHRHA